MGDEVDEPLDPQAQAELNMLIQIYGWNAVWAELMTIQEQVDSGRNREVPGSVQDGHGRVQ